MQDVKQILIKDDKGQFKTVDLIDDKQQTTDNKQQITQKQTEIKKFIPPKFYFDVKDEEEASKFVNKESEAVREKKYKLLQKEANLLLLDLKLDEQDSALVGIVLGSLAKQSSNEEFADIAYGDEINNKFVWENL